MAQPIIIIAGPTASGKSALGIKLAKEVAGEIVNIDSVQMYEGFSIGSARITDEEMEGVPHHLLGSVSPAEPFDVARYVRMATDIISLLHSQSKAAVFVGGTSLYITSLLYGLADLPKADPQLRESLEQKNSEKLFSELKELDPEAAGALHPNDRVRIIRALEAILLTSQRVSAVRAEHGQKVLQHDAVIIVPLWNRAELYNRINQRSMKMIDAGLIEETTRLLSQHPKAAPAFRTIGYEEVCRYLENQLSREKLEEEISLHTRRFAKRQMTWLRNEPHKRGWKVRPAEGEEGEILEGDMSGFSRPNKMKHFTVLRTDFKGLANALKTKLNQGVNGVEVWFVPGSKVI